MKVDVTARGELPSAVGKGEETLGLASILVNNAGITVIAGVPEQDAEDRDRVIETNLSACFLLSRRVAQSMVKRREGKIINIASMFSFFGSGLVPSDSAAKGALVLTKPMAIELAPFNIQVNAIAPGWIDTDIVAPVKTAPALYERIIARTPAARLGNPGECAGTAVYLASRALDFVTGATICVDAGNSIR